MSASSRQHGFTLIEILVATVILAIMGVMAYRGIAEARVAVENAEGHLDRLRTVQRAVQTVVTDFRTLTRRPVREPIGDGTRATVLRDPERDRAGRALTQRLAEWRRHAARHLAANRLSARGKQADPRALECDRRDARDASGQARTH